MASGIRVRVLIPFILLFLSSISSLASPEGSDIYGSGRRDLLGFMGAAKRKNVKEGEVVPNCREMGTRSECGRNLKWCRWCSSEALDDMCFGSSEARRLPYQVFTCESAT